MNKNILFILHDLKDQNYQTISNLMAALNIAEEDIIKTLPHKKQVLFAYKCACSVQHLIKSKHSKQELQQCLELIQQWLQDPNSVTKKQLRDAAYAAVNAASYAVDAAVNAASYAVDAAVNAAYAAVNAAYAAVNAASYAVNVSYAASYIDNKQQHINFKFLIDIAYNN